MADWMRSLLSSFPRKPDAGDLRAAVKRALDFRLRGMSGAPPEDLAYDPEQAPGDRPKVVPIYIAPKRSAPKRRDGGDAR
ncbi:hypothetical protein [Lysobacter sp. 22409]|uniref:hypothetical protein n=1 Tax=Lysobacter sp. 22409 TaxID=3453917 RepID=UPI003F828D15